jgi:hypothetical protein
LSPKLSGARLGDQGKAWVLAGPDKMSCNDPGKEPVVKFMERMVTGIRDTLEVAPVTATIFSIPVK